MKAGLLPKKNRGETVSLVLTLHYGNDDSLKGQTAAAGMLPGLMMAGTKKHDRQALREELDSLGVRISPGGGGGGRGGRGGRGGGGVGGTPGQLTFSVEAKRDDASPGARAARRDPPRAGLPRGGVRDLEAPDGLDALRRPHRTERPGRQQAGPDACRPTRRTTCATCRPSRRRSTAPGTSRSNRSRRCTRHRSAARTPSWASSATSTPRARCGS